MGYIDPSGYSIIIRLFSIFCPFFFIIFFDSEIWLVVLQRLTALIFSFFASPTKSFLIANDYEERLENDI